ncbi:MAG: M48 family peptidase, partial [Zetaproteobacteria bacterium]
VTLEAHRKAADYTIARLRLGWIGRIIDLLLFLGWTVGGGLAWLDHALRRTLTLDPLAHSVALMLLFLLIGALLDLPLSLYRTFRLEAAFGFNRTTPATFFADLTKHALLVLLIGTPLLALIVWLMIHAGPAWWFDAWLVWGGFSLLMLWLYPTLIAPLFNKFTPLEADELRQRIDALLNRCGFENGGLFVMDGSRRSAHGNAYFTGFGRNKRIVFFDTLLKQLTPTQVEAVLAHELGHFKQRHILQRIVWSLLLSLIGFALLGWLGNAPWFLPLFGIDTPSAGALLALFTLLVPWLGFWLAPLMNLLSRRHEFQADAYACAHSDATALADALIAMYEENAATLTPDPLWSAWHDSHPPAPIRIDHLTRSGTLGGQDGCASPELAQASDGFARETKSPRADLLRPDHG